MKNLPLHGATRTLSRQEDGVPTRSHSVGPALDSRTLFAGGNEIVIAHGAEHYRLRLTRQNRLILTK